jgi:hypothetical protein
MDFGSTETYAGSVSLTHVESQNLFEPDATSFSSTFDVSGTDASDVLILCGGGEATTATTNMFVDNIVINGVTASAVVQTNYSLNQGVAVGIFAIVASNANINSNTTNVTVTINFNTTFRRTGLSVYRLKGVGGVIPSFTTDNDGVNASAAFVSTSASAGDVTVAVVYNNDAFLTTPASTDLSIDYQSTEVELNNGSYGVASKLSTSSETLTTTSATDTNATVAAQATFSAPAGNKKNSGIWDLQAVYESIEIVPPVVLNYNDEIANTSGGAPDFRWTFNGTIAEASAHSTAPIGSFSYTTGLIPNITDQSANMSGSEYLVPSNDPLINTGTGYSWTKRSVSFWFNADATGFQAYPCIWEEGGGVNWMSIYFDNGLIYANIGENSSTGGHATASVSTGTTYHCLVTFDLTLGSNNIKIYLNGSLAGQATSSVGTDLADHSGDNRIGSGAARNHLGNSITYASYDGRLQDLCYWNEVALTATDANNIYAAGIYT